MFDHVRPALADCDVLFGNLEVPISTFDRDRDRFESIHFRAQPEAAEGLAEAGFNVLNLANNHIMQHGRSAVLDTMRHLQTYDIDFVGIEDGEVHQETPLITSIRGARIGFLGYNLRPLQYFGDPPMYVEGTADRIERDIEEHRSRVDWLVISLHWGDEFVDRPSAEQVCQARRFVDAGATAVLGHHPHMLQGVEQYNGGVIAYSLGDFVFDLWQPRLRETMVLRIDLDPASGVRYEIIPCRINDHWQPEVLYGPAADAVKGRVGELSSLIDEDLPASEYASLVAAERARFRREMWWRYLTHLHRFRAKDLYGNAKRILWGRLRIGRGAQGSEIFRRPVLGHNKR